MKNFSVKTVQDFDLNQIVTIENESYSQPWSFSHFNHELKNKYALNCKLTADNVIIGYSFAVLLLDEFQINNFCIKSNYQNQGFGSALLDHTLSEAKNRGAKNAFLEVRENNYSAIKLYQKFNFKISGVRKKFYSTGENALMMVLKID